MKKTGLSIILLFFVVLQCVAESGLERGFIKPPASAKACTWWHWINGNVSKEGITADLEAMKEAGIQDAQIFNVDMGYPEGPATYLGEHWSDLFRFALTEASRLGLEIGFHNSAGWANSGGPWVTPEYSMQKLVYTETQCKGGDKSVLLACPEAVRDYYRDIAVIAFPKPAGSDRIKNLDFKNLSGRIRNHLEPDTAFVPAPALVKSGDVIDLSSKMQADGTVDWRVPSGEWIVLRIGHTSTGAENHPAVIGGRGLEIDKMSRKATDYYWKNGVEPILDNVKEFVGSTLVDCVIDSYEVGVGNWTDGFDRQFERLRAYPFAVFLPTLAGYYVDGVEQTERFLRDYRRTVGDPMADNYYGRFRELCHERGLMLYVEPYWGPYDSMQVGDRGDLVMCEFWSGVLGAFDSAKFVSSIAHLNGNPVVGAEAFTSFGAWLDYPANVKSVGDKAWAEGVNRFTFHSFAHQPWNVGPGLTFGHYGMDFNRLNTWWSQGRAYLDYIARSQFLLQQGHSVADVLVFVGESSPNNAMYMPAIKKLGYDYELIGIDKLLTLTCEAGIIRSRSGGEYRILYLPESRWMTPGVLAKIEELAGKGAVIIGEKPRKSPSLSDFPACDTVVGRIADGLWNSGKAKDISLTEALGTYLPIPDFQLADTVKSDISFIHRRCEEGDIYFIANRADDSATKTCRFRVSGKQPELWNPQSGEISDVLVWQDNADGTVSVPVDFDPDGSVFIIFRKTAPTNHIVDAETDLEEPVPELFSDLEIVKAEYGSFLPAGLADVKDVIKSYIKDGRLRFSAGNHLCQADPAPGFIKELRMAYELDGVRGELTAAENELVELNVDGSARLEIIGAAYGQYDPDLDGVPTAFTIYDVKDSILSAISSGKAVMEINDGITGSLNVDGLDKELRITYFTGDKTWLRSVLAGDRLYLGPRPAKSRFIRENGADYWLTPYKGKLKYRTSSGEKKTVTVDTVPAEIEPDGSWHVDFGSFDTVFDRLRSWTVLDDIRIRYFSGTATYRNSFTLTDEYLATDVSLELDLGDVNVFAEVSVNGKPLGILWKAPYKVDLGDSVKVGVNELDIKVTNLWPNRLIGDELLPEDYEMDGTRISRWPDWLVNGGERNSGRTTFTTWKHWNKDSDLLPSGLCGPVVLRAYVKRKIADKINLSK